MINNDKQKDSTNTKIELETREQKVEGFIYVSQNFIRTGTA